jgi:hypothetical protein
MVNLRYPCGEVLWKGAGSSSPAIVRRRKAVFRKERGEGLPGALLRFLPPLTALVVL